MPIPLGASTPALVAPQRYKPHKGDKRDVTNPSSIGITDPNEVPETEEDFKRRIEELGIQEPMTVWRVDRLRKMTYSQLWKLVGAGHIDWVQPSLDQRSVIVRTRES